MNHVKKNIKTEFRFSVNFTSKIRNAMFFFVSIFGVFLFANNTMAAYCYCADNLGWGTNNIILDTNNKKVFTDGNLTDNQACSNKCATLGSHYLFFFSQNQDDAKSNDQDYYTGAVSSGDKSTVKKNDQQYQQEIKKTTEEKASDVCGGNFLEKIVNPAEAFKCLLYGVLQVFGWLLGVAAVLFGWIVNPDNVSGAQTGLLNHHAIKDVWFMVRDTLNMTFIMVLLFAAFCTVFQVDSWNLKKVWLNILINSLLVNFSFPIARLFIDISNVAMYYFLNNLFTGQVGGGSNIMATFGNFSGISGLLIPKDYASASIAYLIAAIVVTFILATTMMVLAVLFLIRLIWLAVLLMFSPVGFVGYIFPETKHFASDWWNELFKNAFFGPIMVFMMMVAINMMKAFPSETIRAVSVQNTPAGMDNAWIGGAAFYAVPIAILWTAMGISQKMGVEGASFVVGAGKKWGGTVGNWVKNGAIGGAKWATYKNPVARGIKEGGKEKLGINRFIKWWKAPSKIEAGIKGGIVGVGKAGGIRGGAKSELDKLQYAEVRDAVEEHKKNKTSHSQLALDLVNSNNIKKKAAAIALAENDDIRNAQEFKDGIAALAGDPNLTNKFIQKGHSAIQDSAGLKEAVTALGNDTKSIGTLIEKVGGNAIEMNQADFDSLNVAIDLKNPGGTGDGVKKQLKTRMKKEGHVQTLVASQAMANGGSQAAYNTAYNDLVADMTPEELSKQRDSLHNSHNFVSYVMNNSGNNQTFSDEHRKNVFAELSGKKKSIWFNNGIHP